MVLLCVDRCWKVCGEIVPSTAVIRDTVEPRTLMSSSPPLGSTNHSRGQEPPPEPRAQSGLRRLHSPLPWSQRATRLLGDWMGITILFFLWIAMLVLVAHNVIIPRTLSLIHI